MNVSTYKLVTHKEMVDKLNKREYGKYVCKETDGRFVACVFQKHKNETKRFNSMVEAGRWVTAVGSCA